MPDCCIQNCGNNVSDTAYFKFPVHNPELLQKWLKQIGKPNWTPNENSYICAIHFCGNDIINYPNRKYLVLKENAIPTIFPKQMNQVLSLKPQRSEISAINNLTTVKSSIVTIPSLIQTTPLVLTPTIVEPVSTMNSTLLPLPGRPQRFRKILPKMNQSSNALTVSSRGKNDIASNTPPKSYIIIIPTFDNTKSISAPSNPPKLPSLNNKKPILRLTVNRKYDIDPSLAKSKKISDNRGKTKSDSICEHIGEENGNNLIEEVVIKHETLNKFVVFSLDVITGEISVTYRNNSSVPGRNAKLLGTHMKLRENPRKRKIWEEPEELGNMYKRVKKDCSTLRSRLQILRKKHKKERDAIETLQKKLAAIDTNQVMASTMTAKSIDKSPTNVINIDSETPIDGIKLFCEETKENGGQLPTVNEQLKLTLNNNQHMSINDKSHVAKSIEMEYEPFIWRTNEENGHCDFIGIDEATVTIQTSDLKTPDSYANFNDITCVND